MLRTTSGSLALRRVGAFAGLSLVFGCRTVRPTASLSIDGWCTRVDSLRAANGFWDRDDLFEAATRLLPGGFGGITTTYMYLKQPSLADSARRTAQRISAACSNDEYAARLWSLVQTVAIRQGRYDWIELRSQWAVVLKHVPWDGVRSGGISEAVNRLKLSFTNQGALDTFRARAVAAKVPLDMLVLEVERGSSWPQTAGSARTH